MAMRNRKPRLVSKKYIQFLVGVRWTIYVLLSFVFFLIMTSGNPDNIKPVLLLPFALSLCIFYGEIASAAIGFYCGILIDYAAGRLIGASSLLMVILCVAGSMLFLQRLRRNIINFMVISAVSTIIYFALDFYLYFSMWDYVGTGTVLLQKTLPTALLTLALSPLVYLITKFITQNIGMVDRTILEEQNKNIERV